MSSKYTEHNVVYAHGDVTQLQFADQQFDFVIDKGLLDSILSSSNATSDLQKMFSEIKRVITPTGVYIVITPHEEREFYFRRYNWKIQKYSFPRKQPFHSSLSADPIYYCFVLTLQNSEMIKTCRK